MKTDRIAGLAIALCLVAGCAATQPGPVQNEAPSRSLAGTVWTGRGEPARLEDLERAAGQAHFVVLGETHGNPDHHRMQASLLSAAAKGGPAPVLVWEMLPRSRQDNLTRYLTSEGATSQGLGAAVGWEDLGWPDWSLYEPIARVALDAGLVQRAGDLDRSKISKIAQGVQDVLPPDDRAAKAIEDSLSPELERDLERVLMEAHCNLLPEAAIPGIKAAQRARDGALAAAMTQDGMRAVLIAGRGHARRDWAVPRILDQSEPQATVLSVGLLETVDGALDPNAYGLLSVTGEPLFDYIYFADGPDRGDPCAGLEERFSR